MILRFFKNRNIMHWTSFFIIVNKSSFKTKTTYQETLQLSRDHSGYQSKELVPRTAGR